MAEEKYKVGDRFGKWTLIEKLPMVKKNSQWKVRCDCGVERSLAAGNIYSGRSKSCRSCGAKKRWGSSKAMAAGIVRSEARKAKVNEIYSYLVNLIEAGKVKPGEKLPTTTALVDMFDTNTNVVQDARNLLKRSGLIVIKNNQHEENGTYVL